MAGKARPFLERLDDCFLIGEPGCWEWSGPRFPNGYGSFWMAGRRHMAHRVVYETYVGPIPDGLVIDHICRNKACVRPDHLEPVSKRDNLLRGSHRSGWALKEARKTHCPHGHPYDAENTWRDKHGHRHCRTCQRERQRRTRCL